MAHVRQSRPDSGLGFQVQALEMFQLFFLDSDAGPRWACASCSNLSLAAARAFNWESRPQSGLDYFTGARFARQWLLASSASPLPLPE